MNIKPNIKITGSTFERINLCPSSAFYQNTKKTETFYSREGVLAHSVFEDYINAIALGEVGVNTDRYVDEEFTDDILYNMLGNANKAINYIKQFDFLISDLIVERKLIVNDVYFGRADAYNTYRDEVGQSYLHIFDYKYGEGIKVNAYKNEQLMFYTLALSLILQKENVLSEADLKHTIFRATILQPRLDNFETYEFEYSDLINFFNQFKTLNSTLDKIAEGKLDINNFYNPSEKACLFCPAKASCPALLKETKKIIDIMNKDAKKISDIDILLVLKAKKSMMTFLNAIEKDVTERLLSGNKVPSLKLVEGRSITKYTDDAEKVLVDKLGRQAYNKKLISITEAKKILGDEKAILNSVTHKPAGRPVWDFADSKKPEIIISDLSTDFN